MPHRPERLAEMIREELTDLVIGELADPRIGLATVTEVKLPPEMRVAHIFVSVAGTAEEQQRSLHGLMSARGFLRSELATRLQMRHVPELRFELDKSEELGARLDHLLGESQKRVAAVVRKSEQMAQAEENTSNVASDDHRQA